tara:strand:- start:305 stop:469 length:165 start_codon:yes stop_codon:yes gene_type:complete
MLVRNGGPDIELNEAVLFPFDKWSMPLRYRLRYGLIGAANPYKMHEKDAHLYAL